MKRRIRECTTPTNKTWSDELHHDTDARQKTKGSPCSSSWFSSRLIRLTTLTFSTVCSIPLFFTDTFSEALTYWHDLFVLKPLRMLYLQGPAVYGYGFWQGKTDSHICVNLSDANTDPRRWTSNPQDCTDLIERRFEAFVTLVQLAVYFYIMFNTITSATHVVTQTIPRAAWRWVVLAEDNRSSDPFPARRLMLVDLVGEKQ